MFFSASDKALVTEHCFWQLGDHGEGHPVQNDFSRYVSRQTNAGPTLFSTFAVQPIYLTDKPIFRT